MSTRPRCRHHALIRAKTTARRLWSARPSAQLQTTFCAPSRLTGARGGRMKTWLKVAEAAEYAGVSRDTIYTACERRSLRHTRVGGRRSIRFKPEWIDEWL